MENNIEYNVYIDESGDEGINRGSRWFILTAIIVRKDCEQNLLKTMKNITKKLNFKFIHWNKIKQYSTRKFIIDNLCNSDFKIIHVMIDTQKMGRSKSERIYPYFLGFLLERVSSLVKMEHAKANIFISSRNNKQSNKDIIEYIESERSNNNVQKELINFIKFVPNANMILLQLADVCCSSLYNALTKNDSKSWYYIIRLKEKIYSQNNKILGYGFKAFPNINKLEYINILKLI